ncbi:MAG: hypothetical protein HFP77_04930 [Methylococcales symbiont of Iophon sp. n. MRB-2018]|nr:MAG: hypothetical protein HFP77_04930 [Methylococcales symbiont of Iophon sp. n. MRB-2018]KAF3979956.1 MAG: hypothetical protein HFP76_04460 [Methylococcales symbiont of Iophon sp. n. MRB-2018]
MTNNFESWLQDEIDLGLKDIKLAIGGDTSNASVAKAKEAVIHIQKLAKAGFVESFPCANNYSDELVELNDALESRT